MVDDGGQVCFGNLWKHFTHSAANVIFSSFLSCWAAMHRLSVRIAFNLLDHPVLPVTSPGLAQTRLFIVFVAELATSKLDDIERKMMSYAVNVVREFLRIGMRLVLRFRLWNFQYVNVAWNWLLLTETTCTSRFRWRHCSLHHSVISGCPAGTKPKP